MYINREETCGDKFSMRITFISEATKTVVQSCQEHKTMKNSERLIQWIKSLLSLVSEMEEEKGFNHHEDQNSFRQSCKIVLWTIPLERALDWRKRQRRSQKPNAEKEG